MSSERTEILQALQQQLLEAVKLVEKLLEANNGDLQRTDPTTQAQLAEYNHAYWKAQTLRATKASVFDHCFHNTFPHWNAPKFVRTVRKAIGRFDELGAKQLFKALQMYEAKFGNLRKEHDRMEAHRLAIAIVKHSLPVAD